MAINREEKRKLARHLKKKGFSKDQIEAFMILKNRDAYDIKIKVGDKVQLDREAIIGDPNWKRKIPEYKQWCLEHFGKTFTAEIYKEERPELWQLGEDKTNPKWLIHASELILVEENPA